MFLKTYLYIYFCCAGSLLLHMGRAYSLVVVCRLLIDGTSGKETACLGQKDPLEKGMATHSSILVWRIP